jgi:hypothetical protein
VEPVSSSVKPWGEGRMIMPNFTGCCEEELMRTDFYSYVVVPQGGLKHPCYFPETAGGK